MRYWRHKKGRILVGICPILMLNSGLLLGMNNPVLDEKVTLAEALLTFTTFIQFLSFLDTSSLLVLF